MLVLDPNLRAPLLSIDNRVDPRGNVGTPHPKSIGDAFSSPGKPLPAVKAVALVAPAKPANVLSFENRFADDKAITKFFNEYSNADAVTEIQIMASHLEDLSFLTRFKNLKKLTITGGEFKNLSALKACTALECLVLRNSSVTSLEGIEDLPLTELDVSGCKSLCNISHLPKSLTKLDLSNCWAIATLSHLTRLQVLRELNVAGLVRKNLMGVEAPIALPALVSLILTKSELTVKDFTSSKAIEIV